MSDARRIAVIVGASGAIGGAMADLLESNGQFDQVVRLSRNSLPFLDLSDEETISRAARHCRELGAIELFFNASGFLHGEGVLPEKSLKQLTPEALTQNFAINALGPALLMKHFLPIMPKSKRSVFASLSAKVGSISDNRLGGWHSYRAAKAAQNQLIKSASIEMARTHSALICVAMHPGTVQSDLSAPFAKSGLNVRPASEAAQDILKVLDSLTVSHTGKFFSYDGEELPW